MSFPGPCSDKLSQAYGCQMVGPHGTQSDSSNILFGKLKGDILCIFFVNYEIVACFVICDKCWYGE